ncbi:hypothetical protein AYI68_g84 [Smittium mucronatum]|uniref:DMAP1-binding domain-containing protein n=1 Tax=Smittium mucronatum TaxID=133383 RepID=A0A1R0H956_9FUNG|nr:hypothetical protein AYI68_g84 [Smittium mucronatum]
MEMDLPTLETKRRFLLESKLESLKNDYLNDYITEKGYNAKKESLKNEFPDVFFSVFNESEFLNSQLPVPDASIHSPGISKQDNHTYNLNSSNPSPPVSLNRFTASSTLDSTNEPGVKNGLESKNKFFPLGDSQEDYFSSNFDSSNQLRNSTFIKSSRENLIKSLANNRDTMFSDDDNYFLKSYYEGDEKDVGILHNLINPSQNNITNFKENDYNRRYSSESDSDGISDVISLKQLNQAANEESSCSRIQRISPHSPYSSNEPLIYENISEVISNNQIYPHSSAIDDSLFYSSSDQSPIVSNQMGNLEIEKNFETQNNSHNKFFSLMESQPPVLISTVGSLTKTPPSEKSEDRYAVSPSYLNVDQIDNPNNYSNDESQSSNSSREIITVKELLQNVHFPPQESKARSFNSISGFKDINNDFSPTNSDSIEVITSSDIIASDAHSDLVPVKEEQVNDMTFNLKELLVHDSPGSEPLDLPKSPTSESLYKTELKNKPEIDSQPISNLPDSLMKPQNLPFPEIDFKKSNDISFFNSSSFYRPREIYPSDESSELDVIKNLGDISSILKYRANKYPDVTAYTCINNRGDEIGNISWLQLYKKSMIIYEALSSSNVKSKGERVALVYRKYEFISYISSMYACFFGGFVAVPLVSNDSIDDLVYILDQTNCKVILSSQLNIDALRRDVQQHSRIKPFESGAKLNEMKWLNTDIILGEPSSHTLQPGGLSTIDLAYIEYTKGSTGELKGVMVSHGALISQCIGWAMNLGMMGFSRKKKSYLESDKASVRKNSSNTPYSKSILQEQPSSSRPNSRSNSDAFKSSSSNFRPTSVISNTTVNSYVGKTAVVPALTPNPLVPKILSTTSSKHKEKKRGSLNFFSKIINSTGISSTKKSPKSSPSTHNKIIGLNSPIDSYLDNSYAKTQPSIISSPSIHSYDISSENNTFGFPDSVLIQTDPRQTLGLTLGIFASTFSGNHSIYLSRMASDNACLYLQLLTKYRISIAVSDYNGLQKVLTTAADDPDAINNYNRLPNPNLSNLRLVLINTLYIDTEFHRIFNNVVLRRYGCPVIQILENENRPVLTPIITLPEHNGLVLSLENSLEFSNDLNLSSPMTNISSSGSYNLNGVSEVCLNHFDLLHEKITIVQENELEPSELSNNTIKIPLFGPPTYYSTIAIVNPETRILSDGSSVGEIWVDSLCVCEGFWRAPELSEMTYAAHFYYKNPENNLEIYPQQFLRTGLMGALIQGRLLVLGYYEDRLKTGVVNKLSPGPFNAGPPIHYSGRIVTILQQNYSSSIDGISFEIFVNNNSFIVFLVELSDTSVSLANAAQDISSILLRKSKFVPYAIGICSSNFLPRSYKYGIYSLCSISCKKLWHEGQINCLYIRFSSENLHLGLPPPLGLSKTSNPNLDMFTSYTEAGIPIRILQKTSPVDNYFSSVNSDGFNLVNFKSISQLLIDRANFSPNAIAFTEIDHLGYIKNSISYYKLLARVSSLAKYYRSKLNMKPDEFALISISAGIEFLCAIHACLAIGVIPVILTPITDPRLSNDLSAMISVVVHFKIRVILVDSVCESTFNSSPPTMSTLNRYKATIFNQTVKAHKMDNMSLLGKSGFLPAIPKDKDQYSLTMLYNGTQVNGHTCVFYTQTNIFDFCTHQIKNFNITHLNPLIASARSYNGFGLLHISFLGIFSGSQTFIFSPESFLLNPLTWIGIISKYKIKTPFSTIPMLEHALNVLQKLDPLKFKNNDLYLSISNRLGPNISLEHVTNLLVASEDRSNFEFLNKLTVFLSRYRLNPNTISPLYGSQMSPAISFRSYGDYNSLSLQLDLEFIRQGIVSPILQRIPDMQPQPSDYEQPLRTHSRKPDFDPRTSHPSIFIQDSGKVSKSSIVVIVDPETKMILELGKIGEIWVYDKSNSSHISSTNADKKFISSTSSRNSFNIEQRSKLGGFVSIDKLSSKNEVSDSDIEFVRTGDYGFLLFESPNNSLDSPYLFVLGKFADVIKFQGYTYFRSDIEATIISIILLNYKSAEECILIETSLPRYPTYKAHSDRMSISGFRDSISLSRKPLNNQVHTRKFSPSIIGYNNTSNSNFDTLSLKDPSKTHKNYVNDNLSMISSYPQEFNSQKYNDNSPVPIRYVVIVTINTLTINQGLLGNLASLIFQSILNEHKFPISEVVFVSRNSLTRSRVLEKKISLTTSQYESGNLKAIISFSF